jgi:hypothetical protein
LTALETGRRIVLVHRGKLSLALAILLSLAFASGAGSRSSKDVAPFQYTFQITSIAINATFSHGSESATTVLHLAQPPKQRALTWWGKHGTGGGTYNGVGAARVYLAGTISYSGLDPVCTGTVNVAMPPSYSVVASIYLGDARDAVVTHPTIRLSFGKFAIGDIYPGANGKCRNALTFYQYADDLKPFSVVGAPGITFTVNHDESFADDTFTDGVKTEFQWTATVTVHKVRYFLIDCSHTQGC